MIEALMATFVIFTFLFLGIKLSEILLKQLALENFSEDFLICKKTLSTSCESDFDSKLKLLSLAEVKYKYENHNLFIDYLNTFSDRKNVAYSLKQ